MSGSIVSVFGASLGAVFFYCFLLRFRVMTMPRWIDDPTCDSSAMLGAYFNYHMTLGPNDAKACSFTDLYMVVHRPDDTPVPAIRRFGQSVHIPTRLCSTRGCRRCTNGIGGYKFRWYHIAWEEQYLHAKRPGAWVPGADLPARTSTSSCEERCAD